MAFSVVATQGLGAAVVSQASGIPQFNQWFLYVLLVFVVVTLLVEIIYLNVGAVPTSSYNLTDHGAESLKHLQRRISHSHILRLLHLCYHGNVGYPLPRI